VRPGLEADLAQLWAQLLGLETVAPHEDFFALGGHSLLATRLVARIREQFGREIPLLAVFEHPTVSGLARIMADLPDAGEAGNRPVLKPVSRQLTNSRPE
jgi:acyl carrier protein